MLILLYSPFPTLESARSACAALLNAQAVACCNLITGTESLYLWQGTLTQATETILIAKTTPSMAERARALIATHHPHKVPSILSFSADSNPEFAAWVAASVTPQKNSDKGD